MGECNYYLKARFATDAKARDAVPRLVALLAEGEQAYDYWQNTRRQQDQARRPSQRQSPQEQQQIAAQFWSVFQARFPLVCDYLGDLVGIEDWSNGLAGQLGSLVDPQHKRRGDPSSSLVCRESLLLLRLNGIWHCSKMRLLEEFCKDELGAVAVGSVSEEEFDEDDSDIEEPDFDPFAFIDV